MNVLGLAWRGVKHRRLSSILTGASVALGVALVVLVISARESARDSYVSAARGYDLLIGPTQATPFQTTLNTMFHLGDAGGTIPWEVYQEISKDGRVSYAVPYVVGDNFRGHHVVGTTRDHFNALKDRAGRRLGDGIRGRIFEPRSFEAVLGSQVAQKERMRLGDSFRVVHGSTAGVGEEHGEEWDVVGILRPTGTPSDRAVFIHYYAFYEIEGHKEAADDIRERREKQGDPKKPNNHHGHSHGDGDEHVHGLSAVGVKLYVPRVRFEIVDEYRKDRRAARAIMPVQQIGDLLDIIEQVDAIFRVVAWLVVLVAAVSILVGLYNTIQGRRREIAILRAMGATPRHIFFVIVSESLLICLIGGIVGLVVGHLGIAAAAPILVERYGVLVTAGVGMLELQIVGVLIFVGLLAGALPAWRGLKTPVAENLHPVD